MEEFSTLNTANDELSTYLPSNTNSVPEVGSVSSASDPLPLSVDDMADFGSLLSMPAGAARSTDYGSSSNGSGVSSPEPFDNAADSSVYSGSDVEQGQDWSWDLPQFLTEPLTSPRNHLQLQTPTNYVQQQQYTGDSGDLLNGEVNNKLGRGNSLDLPEQEQPQGFDVMYQQLPVKKQSKLTVKTEPVDSKPATVGPALAALLSAHPQLLADPSLAAVALTCNSRKGGTHESRAKAKAAAMKVAEMIGCSVDMLPQLGAEIAALKRQGVKLPLSNGASTQANLTVTVPPLLKKVDSHSSGMYELETAESDSPGSSPSVSPYPASDFHHDDIDVKVEVNGKPRKVVRRKSGKPSMNNVSTDSVDGDEDDDCSGDGLDDLLTEVESKKKRLARKAELARMSRKRKKTRMGDLEAEVERLQNELQALKRQKGVKVAAVAAKEATVDEAAVSNTISEIISAHNNAEDRAHATNAHLTDGTSLDDSMSSDSAESSELEPTTLTRAIDQFVRSHTTYIAAGEQALAAVGQQLSPVLPLEFLTWICNSVDDAQAQNSSAASLWTALFSDELGLTGEQIRDLHAVKTTIKKQSKLSAEVSKAYNKLHAHLSKQLKQRVENVEKLRAILSPNQFAQYLEWVDKYGNVCLKIGANGGAGKPADDNERRVSIMQQ